MRRQATRASVVANEVIIGSEEAEPGVIRAQDLDFFPGKHRKSEQYCTKVAVNFAEFLKSCLRNCYVTRCRNWQLAYATAVAQGQLN